MSTIDTEVRRPPQRKHKTASDAGPADLGNAAPASAMTNALGDRLPRPQLVDAKSRIIWPYIIGVAVFHLLVPLAFLSYVFSWWGVVWLPIGNFIFCSMGIGAGYHRLLTHRGYKCPPWLEHTLAVLGMCNLQDSPARWVVVHRMHH